VDRVIRGWRPGRVDEAIARAKATPNLSEGEKVLAFGISRVDDDTIV